jgi:hypothetical protein
MALMAPPQAPSLEVTAPDDDMEISSDAGRVEHDNDIDLVDDDDDIDYMLEDTRSEQGQPRIDEMPDAARDDIMYDDLDEITYGEDDMHDDVPVPDEHLTDVSEFHHDPGFGQFAQPQASEEQTTPTQIHASSSFDATIASGHQAAESDALIETVDYVEQSYNDPTPTANADPAPTEPDAPVSELQTNEQEDVREPGGAITTQSDAQGEEVLASYDGLDAPFDETSNTEQLSETTNPTSHDVPEPALNDDEYIDTTPQHQLNSPKRTEQQESAISLQQEEPISLLSQDKAEAPASPKQAINNDLEEVQDSEEGARSFHTTIVDYEGAHISLFPPMQDDDADMFLLKDPTLADKTLVDLFRACRQVLGESIDDDLELEIYSEDLDLTISEVSCYPSTLSRIALT